MFLHTQAALFKIVQDIKRVQRIFNTIPPIIFIAYFVYASIAGIGIIYVNIALAVLTAAQLAVYLSTNIKGKSRSIATHTIKRLKLFTQIFSLGANVYGIYLANEKATVFSIVFAAISVIAWIFQVLLEILASYAEAQFELIKEGFKADFDGIRDGISKPINAAKDFINKISGKEPQETEPEAKEPPSRTRILLEKKVEEMIAEKRRKKEEKKKKKEEESVH